MQDLSHSACSLLAATLTAMFHTSASSAEYLIHSGDVLELTVAGAPEFQKRSPVGVDGFALFPLLGRVFAEGESVTDALKDIRGALPKKAFQDVAPDGHEYPVIVSSDAIDLVIAEYRPIHVNGDVSRPGEVSFRPGLTVRNAIALSVGYDVIHFRMTNPFLEQADLRAEYEAQWVEFAKERAHIARVETELSSQSGIDPDSLKNMLLRQSMLGSLMANGTAIVRKNANVIQSLDVEQDTTLVPGDVIEVKLATVNDPATSARAPR